MRYKKRWIMRGRKRSNSTKLVRLKKIILLIERLKKKGGATFDQIVRQLDVHPRTAYRYLQLIEECDLPLEKDFNEKYFLPR